MILNGCTHPIRLKNGQFVPCGRCLQCCVDKRSVWATRLQIEIDAHDESSFVTCTYAQEHLPETPTDQRVNMQLFQKQLRKDFYAATGKHLRFFSASERGNPKLGARPHIHSLILGFPNCEKIFEGARTERACQCKWCSMIRNAWHRGFTTLLPAKDITRPGRVADYVAKYCLKHLENRKGLSRQRRSWNFALMSRKPAIGTALIGNVNINTGEIIGPLGPAAQVYQRYPQAIERYGDVASAIDRGAFQPSIDPRVQRDPLIPCRKKFGRTLRQKLRVSAGMKPQAPQRTIDAVNAQFTAAIAAAAQVCAAPGMKGFQKDLILDAIAHHNEPYAAKLRAKQFKQGNGKI